MIHIPDANNHDRLFARTQRIHTQRVFSRFVHLFSFQTSLWWRIRDSNPRPQACKARALPAELIPQPGERLAHRVGLSRPNSEFGVMGLTRVPELEARGNSRKEVIQPQVPLRLPCYDFTPVTRHSLGGCFPKVSSPTSRATDSHGVTGGVYKARERIHRSVLISDY
jgi:hypothetical protein